MDLEYLSATVPCEQREVERVWGADMSSKITCLFTVLIASTWIASAEAQRRPKLKKESSDGKVVNVAGGMIQMRSKQGNVWLLKPSLPSKVTFTGSADKSWLRPGMIARFETTFDKKGQGQKVVKTVQVFTPRPEYQLGTFGGDPKNRRSGVPEKLLVAGLIKRIQDNKVTIVAGKKSKKSYTAELDAKVAIEVDLLGDLNWVQPGDDIRFKGQYYEHQPGKALCSEIEVTSKSLLKRAPTKTRKRRSSKRKSAATEGDKSEVDGQVAEPASDSTTSSEDKNDQPIDETKDKIF
jgi:hypothetical protein